MTTSSRRQLRTRGAGAAAQRNTIEVGAFVPTESWAKSGEVVGRDHFVETAAEDAGAGSGCSRQHDRSRCVRADRVGAEKLRRLVSEVVRPDHLVETALSTRGAGAAAQRNTIEVGAFVPSESGPKNSGALSARSHALTISSRRPLRTRAPGAAAQRNTIEVGAFVPTESGAKNSGALSAEDVGRDHFVETAAAHARAGSGSSTQHD